MSEYLLDHRRVFNAGDQLGSVFSDQPDMPELWDLPRFVNEVEQVRKALGLNANNFYLYGQSWGGVLAIEYALAHQENLKGLIISNMMASIPAFNVFAQNGRYLYCPNGSHFALYDDQVTYFEGLIRFIRDVDDGRQ